MILEDKIKWSTMGEATYNEAQLKHIKLQHDVFAANLELVDLERKEVQSRHNCYKWKKVVGFLLA
jgi:hypothetical protein